VVPARIKRSVSVQVRVSLGARPRHGPSDGPQANREGRIELPVTLATVGSILRPMAWASPRGR